MIDSKPTPAVQECISELLEKNREEQPMPAEAAELNEYVRIDTFISLLKARAFKELA